MSPNNIIRELKKYNNYLIVSHIDPEGDAIGSQLALGGLLKKLKKKYIIVNDHRVPHMYRNLKGAGSILPAKKSNMKYDVAIVLDAPSLKRIGKVADLLDKDKPIINIDHHVSNTKFGQANWVNSKASSAGEMVWVLFDAAKIKPSKDEAEAIYIAIITDTGNFQYSNTNSLSHQIAAKAIDLGVNIDKVAQLIYGNDSLKSRKLLAAVLTNMQVSKDGRIAWTKLTHRDFETYQVRRGETDGYINFARSISGVEVALTFKETQEKGFVKVSFRSKTDFDVNKFAREFNGGGHPAAAGCVIKGTIKQAEKKVIGKLEKSL